MLDSIKPTIGVDLGDKFSDIAFLDALGQLEEQTRIPTTKVGMTRYFSRHEPIRVVLETGTHSRWVSRLLSEMGHEVLVGNARKLQFIYQDTKKSDRTDSQKLAQVGQVRPELLYPVVHRGEEAQQVVAMIQARDALVQARTQLVNHVRGTVKSAGARLKSGSADAFAKLADELPENRRQALEPVMEQIAQLTAQIHRYDKEIKTIAEQKYPDTEVLRQVAGVGPLTSLAFVTTLETPSRFPRGRKLGGFLGMTPRLDQSGTIDRQLPITKAGNPYLRRLLVGSAHYILGPFGPDTDLRCWGLKLAARGGKNAKKRAVVAVARKLAVLLLALWKTRAVYEPLRHANKLSELAANTAGKSKTN